MCEINMNWAQSIIQKTPSLVVTHWNPLNAKINFWCFIRDVHIDSVNSMWQDSKGNSKSSWAYDQICIKMEKVQLTYIMVLVFASIPYSFFCKLFKYFQVTINLFHEDIKIVSISWSKQVITTCWLTRKLQVKES